MPESITKFYNEAYEAEMTTDYTKLAELAKAATPGPWKHAKHGAIIGGVVREYVNGTGQDQLVMSCIVQDGNSGDRLANAEYIAAASPDVVLAILETIRVQAEEIVKLKEALNGNTNI